MHGLCGVATEKSRCAVQRGQKADLHGKDVETTINNSYSSRDEL